MPTAARRWRCCMRRASTGRSACTASACRWARPRAWTTGTCDRLARLVQRIEPVRVSDHASFARAPRQSGAAPVHANDLLPVAFTEAALDIMVANVQRVQERLRAADPGGEPVGLPALGRRRACPSRSSSIALARRSGCGLLLDLNNLVVNALNDGVDEVAAACAWVDAIDPAIVGEIHLAGYHDAGDIVIDDHGSRVHDNVWQVYRHALQRLGPRPTLIEWDTALPELAVLLDEAALAARHAGRVPRRGGRMNTARDAEGGAAPADAAARAVGRCAARRRRRLAARRAAARRARPAGLPRQRRRAGRARAGARPSRRWRSWWATNPSPRWPARCGSPQPPQRGDIAHLGRRAGRRSSPPRRSWPTSPTWPTWPGSTGRCTAPNRRPTRGPATRAGAAGRRPTRPRCGCAWRRAWRCAPRRTRWPASGRRTAATLPTALSPCARPLPRAAANTRWSGAMASRRRCRPLPEADARFVQALLDGQALARGAGCGRRRASTSTAGCSQALQRRLAARHRGLCARF